MKPKKGKLLPRKRRILEGLGENIKLARRRRKFTTQQVAERANIARPTLCHVEKGSEHIAIGVFLRVLTVLGLDSDLTKVAQDDILGKNSKLLLL